MDRIILKGGTPLIGEVAVSGSKNSTLALLAASLLAEAETVLHNVPSVRDVDTMILILEALGARVIRGGERPGTLRIDASHVNQLEAPYELVRKMRASFLVLGPLLARFGSARVSEPGGCAIGVRPVDQHMRGFEALGAEVRLDHGYVEAVGQKLSGAEFSFDVVTVNGTQNVMMAASLCPGETIMWNCAREPEVIELGAALRKMGAEIEGEGTDRITVRGVSKLRGIEHTVAGDRIEAGTLLAAGLITRGDVCVSGIDPKTLGGTLEKLRAAGAIFDVEGDRVRARIGTPTVGTNLSTAPFPGFPTDMQAQFMAVMTLATGSSVITENVFENRFMHVPELQRMGADITVKGRSAHVKGVEALSGAQVMATDLRASASLLLAGLAAEGETTVSRVYHIDRGYERIEEKLQGLGAAIRREG